MGLDWLPAELVTPDISVVEKMFRPFVVYFFLLIALRLAGKREMAQLNTMDFIVLLTLSNTVQNAIIGPGQLAFGRDHRRHDFAGCELLRRAVPVRTSQVRAAGRGERGPADRPWQAGPPGHAARAGDAPGAGSGGPQARLRQAQPGADGDAGAQRRDLVRGQGPLADRDAPRRAESAAGRDHQLSSARSRRRWGSEEWLGNGCWLLVVGCWREATKSPRPLVGEGGLL